MHGNELKLSLTPINSRAPRIAIEGIAPQADGGRYPVRRILGDIVRVEADLLADGHDKLAGELLVCGPNETKFRGIELASAGNDRWFAAFQVEQIGRHRVKLTAWKDEYASFVDALTKKHQAGQTTRLEVAEGVALIRETQQCTRARTKPLLTGLLRALESASEAERRTILLSPSTIKLMRESDQRKFAAVSPVINIDAEPANAAFASWYEMFPRSQSGDAARHGTFQDVMSQLPRVAAMGFDVLYFPPIHPVGQTNRKGRHNTLTLSPGDPGSPYAIGSDAGGHDAIHPELGTLKDFHALREAAAALGITLALDFAIQCSPDHPWLKQHKEWFSWRPDGSLHYAENPPKKYEDIVNVDFYAPGANPALWTALRDVVQFWVNQGIRLFRVDNPHTKPFPFWEWLIADIRSRHPDAVFLAEAFTRPKIMYHLAKIGFSQSYSYFTWRNSKAELEAYLTELTTTDVKEYFRPHFFVNTPDINPYFLQNSGRAGHLIRAAIAAMLSGLWGIYNGFEICEATPIPGREEYFDSEKYALKAWDYDRPGNIAGEIAALNRIRRENTALHSHLGLEFLLAYNDQVLYFRRFARDGNVLLIAISLDPFHVQDAIIEVPLWRFGIADDGDIDAKYQPVQLNPGELPFCIWRLTAPKSQEV
jgi:starch synthase (maltosyl-transferring)